ncbi:MAG: DUF305 domain-containing protein [Pseudomonadota bacterium]
MPKNLLSLRSTFHLAASSCALALTLGTSWASQPPIIQPGAPGEDAKELTPDQAQSIASSTFTKDDVAFMQGMIPHHQQAVEMAALVADRTNNEDIISIAGRIDASQGDEIAFMQDWLSDRGQDVPKVSKAMNHDGDHDGDHHGDHGGMAMDHKMMGMASPEQMEQLAGLEGTPFDRMFLQLMIPHHEGAIRMVEDLLDKPGTAYDPVLYEFTSDIVADQSAEIKTMASLLAGLSEDPRANLAPGFDDAGSAVLNLEVIASLPKPQGFVDPSNPAGLPPALPKDETEEETRDEDDDKTEWSERYPVLDFANTDMAFSGDTLVAGSYHGFNIYKLNTDGIPQLKSSIICPGGQGDVSIVGDLLIMSVEQTRGRVDCGLEGVAEDVSDERFRGLRIFNISDLERPRQVGLVQTCRGSHTHSVVSANNRRIVVYNSGTSSVREEEELEGCVYGQPGDDRTALFSIDVIEIPVRNPSKARITSSPRVFADQKTGRFAGLWEGGDHGEGTQRTRRTDQCHDITVFPDAKLAAGACSGNGIILDISDPLKPVRIDDVRDTGFAYWHSATFNNDGTKVLFTDEWGGGASPRCRASDPETWGADAIYDIVDGKLEFQSYYKIAAPQTEEENCVAHNGSVVPVPGRDIFVQAWYQGGMSIIDFTDSDEPEEIAFFDRGPIHEELLIVGGYWSTYWYDGKIYGTEIVRGLDVFSLTPSEYLTENEIAAAALADMGETFNPQQQFKVTWPDEPVVAHAYLDQLERHGAMPKDDLSELRLTLKLAQATLDADNRDKELASRIEELRPDMKDVDASQAKRIGALRDTLEGIAKRLS